MFQERSIKLDTDQVSMLLSEIGPHLDSIDFDLDIVTILSCPVSFYPGYDFLEIADYNQMPAKSRSVIYKTGDVHVMDWKKETIVNLNMAAPLLLNDETLHAYLPFYFRYASSTEGISPVIESIEDIQWLEEPPRVIRNHIAKMISPFTTVKNGDGSFTVDCCMAFENTLFTVNMRVETDGSIEMIDRGVLIDTLPIMNATLNA